MMTNNRAPEAPATSPDGADPFTKTAANRKNKPGQEKHQPEKYQEGRDTFGGLGHITILGVILRARVARTTGMLL